MVYYPALFQTGVVDGKSSFLTKDYSPLAIYYNKDLFDKAGVPYPKDGWTWDRLPGYCRQTYLRQWP